jgi:cytochrome P450
MTILASTFAFGGWLVIAAVILFMCNCVRHGWRKDLRAVPGPFLARFTRLYRLSMVTKGRAPERYREVHQKFGPVVRLGPNDVSFSDPAAIPIIFGIGTQFRKTAFYSSMQPVYRGQTIDSMFTARDPAIHKALKTPVAQTFSMSFMRNYEGYVDECTDIFVSAMNDLEGQAVDLAIWLQWYAFDVIASVTFQRRFGFLEGRQDVNSMISRLDVVLNMVKLLGVYPELDTPLKAAMRTLVPDSWHLDPLQDFLSVSRVDLGTE